jgi:hypothetical protein
MTTPREDDTMSNLATHLAEQDAITAHFDDAEPRTFTIYIAQDIRAYGTVEVEADDLDAAIAKVDHAYVRKHFSPHGSGSDDFDYDNARAVCLTDAYGDDDEYTVLDIELPDEHIEKSRRAMIRAAAALHNAHNALGLCGYLLPTEAPAPGSGLTDMTAATILDPVLIDIREALDTIAAEVGERAMLEASA